MKWIIFTTLLLIGFFSFTQDTTYRCNAGYVEVKRLGASKIHSLNVLRSDTKWITGKVKRENYEYSYTRTYHGSTQPVYPNEFYKPIKVKSFYYIPVSDITIYYYENGPVFQTFYLDSLILRSYYKNGTTRDIYYLNQELGLDSIHRFYENGKMKTRILGESTRLSENLILRMGPTPEMGLRNSPAVWDPEGRFIGYFPQKETMDVPKRGYPLKQYECHGNGQPSIVITFVQDSIQSNSYDKHFEFFDPQGQQLINNKISPKGEWTGIRYNYYPNGALKWKREVCNDRYCGPSEHWNHDQTLNYIEYYSSKGRDSVVFYKQLKDTLLTWRPPMHFEWGQKDVLTVVQHKQCTLHLNYLGEVHAIRLDGQDWRSYTRYSDKRMELRHSGSRDTLGFPHGEWMGINALNDTVYRINYKHGWLHGPYMVKNSYWEHNSNRTFDMGQEIDSSVIRYKGKLREIHYFSQPGRLVKKTLYFGDDHSFTTDTTFDGVKFYRLLSVHKGNITEIGSIDTTLNLFHTTFYFPRDTLFSEKWTDFNGEMREEKKYYTNGQIKSHWKDEGYIVKTEENLVSGEAPKRYSVRVSFQWTYDESGQLIKKEKFENGIKREN